MLREASGNISDTRMLVGVSLYAKQMGVKFNNSLSEARNYTFLGVNSCMRECLKIFRLVEA